MQQLFEHIANKFIGFSWLDALDIVLISIILYGFFSFLKRNNASVIAKFTVVFLLVGIFVVALGLPMSSALFRGILSGILVIIVVLFALEMKRGIGKLNTGRHSSHASKTLYAEEELRAGISEIVKAVQNLAKNDVGALIVFAQKNVPNHIVESGVTLNANISSQLIEALFIDKAPMHDGAILIHNNTIIAAGCFLPLSQEINIPKELGTRHRAAIGITEAEDVVSIVVSEESGVISVAQDGKLRRYIDGPTLTGILEQIYDLAPGSTPQANVT